MRLDKYLKVSRLIKRRTLANDVADAGRVIVKRQTRQGKLCRKDRRCDRDYLRQPPRQGAGAFY